MARTHDDNRSPNDTQSDGDTQDEDILIGYEDIVPDDGEDPLAQPRQDRFLHLLSQRTR